MVLPDQVIIHIAIPAIPVILDFLLAKSYQNAILFFHEFMKKTKE